MKQMSLMMCAVVCTLLVGCGGKEPLQGEPQTELGAEQNTQVQEETEGTELTGKSEADDLLDKFFAGELDAEGNDLYYQDTFNVSLSSFTITSSLGSSAESLAGVTKSPT